MKRSIELIRLARGYISFSASGGFPDKFFSACRDRGVNLWNIRNVNGTIYADTTIGDYRKMPAVRRNSDMRVQIIKKNGFPFVIHRRRNRIGVIFGIAVFLILLFFLSGSIWTISVEGNETIDENDILKAFREHGVKIGAYVNGIDITAAENAVSTKYPQLSWISLNISGGVAKVLVREGEKKPEIKNENPPSNIVAKYAGQIETYEVYEGTAEQEINAAVDKGDLLISGILTYADGTTVLRHSEGKVIAKTNRTVESSFDDRFNVSKLCEPYKIYVLNFFWLKIPVYTPGAISSVKKKNDVYTFDYEEYLSVNDAVIPIGITDRKLVQKEKKSDLPSERKICFCLDDFFRKQRAEIGDAEIRKSKLTLKSDAGMVKITCNFDLAENICETKEILYTEDGESAK